MKPTLALVGLAHPFEVGYDQAETLLSKTARALENEGAAVLDSGVVMHGLETVRRAAAFLKGTGADALVVCIATWSEDHHLLDLLSEVSLPIILRAYPARDTGSLCCAHQIGAVFTDIGKTYECVYAEPDDPAAAKKTMQIAVPYALARKMAHARVGAIGGRVKGMTEIAYDEFAIKEKLGARVVNLDEKEMTDKVAAMGDGEAKALLETLRPRLSRCAILSTEDALLESVKYYAALKALAEEYELTALSVKCYTTYMGKVCLAYSLLEEEGISCACEGDVTNALTMELLRHLSGKAVNNTDLLYPDEEKNTILFAHCGSSGFSIADSRIELAPVRLADSGVCCRFTAMPGTVTAVNLCGHGETFRLSCMTGQALPCGMEFPGNPTVIRFQKPVGVIGDWILQNGIGHHWMVGYGDFSEILRRFCKNQKIRCHML